MGNMKLLLNILLISNLFIYVTSEDVNHDDHDDEHNGHSICDQAVDVGFVLDSSGSMQYHFDRLKELTKKIHKELTQRIKKLRVGVVTFSNKIYYYQRFITYRAQYFDRYLRRIRWQGKYTRLDAALEYALHTMFMVKHGHTAGATKVIILITDGRQTTNYPHGPVEDPVEKAKHVREDGIILIVIGVVDKDEEMLKKLDGGLGRLFDGSVVDQDILKNIPHDCAKHVCEVELEALKPSCNKDVDIIFVVDSSGSLRGYFPAEQYFIKKVAEQFDIKQANSRVAVVRFSHKVKTEIHLTDYTDMHRLHDAIDAIPYDGETTRIDLGLLNAEIEFRHHQNKNRLNNPAIKKIVVLLTDGKNDKGAPSPTIVAKRLRDIGIQIIAIAVGYDIDDDEMQNIVGQGVRWYKNKDFDDLIAPHQVQKYKGITCEGVDYKEKHSDDDDGHDDDDH